MIDYTLRIVNYQHCMKLEAQHLVSKMSHVQKNQILDKIQLQQSEQPYDVNMSQFIEKLLQTDT